jgi:hypothetical protein
MQTRSGLVQQLQKFFLSVFQKTSWGLRFTKANSMIIDEKDGLCATSFYEEIFLFSAVDAHKKGRAKEARP